MVTFIGVTGVSIVCYLGVLLGGILGLIAPEELHPGKKLFLYLQKIITLILFMVLILTYDVGFWIVLGLALAFSVLFYKMDKSHFQFFPYLFFAFLLPFFSTDRLMFLLSAILVFLYGFPTGSLYLSRFTHLDAIMGDKFKIMRKLAFNYLFFLCGVIVIMLAISF